MHNDLDLVNWRRHMQSLHEGSLVNTSSLYHKFNIDFDIEFENNHSPNPYQFQNF